MTAVTFVVTAANNSNDDSVVIDTKAVLLMFDSINTITSVVLRDIALLSDNTSVDCGVVIEVPMLWWSSSLIDNYREFVTSQQVQRLQKSLRLQSATTAISSSGSHLLFSCLELADFLQDDSYHNWLVQRLFDDWSQLAEALYKVNLNQDILDKIALRLPYYLLTQAYREDKKFISQWLATNQACVVVFNGNEHYYNNYIDEHVTDDVTTESVSADDKAKNLATITFLTSYRRVNNLPIADQVDRIVRYIHDKNCQDSPIRNVQFVSSSSPSSTSESIKVGYWQHYSNDGWLVSKGHYCNNKKEGRWQTYFHNGRLHEDGEYHDDKKSGLWEDYYSNGKVNRIGQHRNDNRIGAWSLYQESGKFFMTLPYDEDGKVITEGQVDIFEVRVPPPSKRKTCVIM